MTDRRRNLLILLLVAGLLAGSAAVLATKDTKLGLDLKGGVSLVYEAQPTIYSDVTGEAIQRSIDIMRERVDRLGVAEPEIARAGENQIDVQLPGASNVQDAISQVGTVAQLFFYDWERNVLDKDCDPKPADAAVTGGPSAGNPGAGSIDYYGAVVRATRCPATKDDNDTHKGLLYAIDDVSKRVRCGPQEPPSETAAGKAEARRALLRECEEKRQRVSRVVEVKRGTVVLQAEKPDGDSDEEKRLRALAQDSYFVLKDDPALRGTEIKNPEQNFDQGAGGTGQPNVTFEFTGGGAKKWQQVTREIAQRGQQQFLPGQDVLEAVQHFAIVLDDELVSAPYIDFKQNPDGIDGRTGSEISGGFTIKSAQSLANLLKTGALPIKLELISQSQVSATLGRQALDQGLTAAIAGFAIVAFFLLVFYRVLGVIAVGALFVYALYFYALVKLIPITLTLPGLAGLILTIGVAADANIVIFERVKEEIRGGRSVAAGIAQGYKRGLGAIIDANVVTFMVAFILFILATAGVKGFAFTLGVGTLTSLFTAVLATQAVLGQMQRSRLISSPEMLGAGETNRRWTLDFMGASRWFFSASGLILLVGGLAVAAKGLEFGIDFESGTRVKTSLSQSASENQIRDVLQDAGFEKPEIQRVTGDRELGGEGFQIALSETGEEVGRIKGVLEQRFGSAENFQSQSIGPTFGESIAESAIIAVIASLLVISAYLALRFDWKFVVPVLIALMHDILITSGVYSFAGREVTTSTVAALLTVLGFSLYDTIIVFDRVRENVPRMPRAAFSQIVNRSMSEVLTRSLATSFCALLPLLGLYFFGGETLKDFAFALIVGTFSGTYSSVFIASPVLTHWKEREEVYRRRRERIAAENNGVVPAYATASHGVTVEVTERKPRARLTSPDDPERGVSAREFEDLVRDIQHVAPAPAAEPERDPAADATPEDLVFKETPKRQKQRKPRNRKHGRNR